MAYYASKSIEFDAGHRVPDHDSKCKNPHGHRYKVELIIGAESLISAGSMTGMVLDFGFMKQILTEKVHDVFDHGFIVYEGDHELRDAFNIQEVPEVSPAFTPHGWKIIVFPYVPTAENIAKWIYEEVQMYFTQRGNEFEPYRIWIEVVVVHETPNSMAMYKEYQ